jgi:hypothetical protein
MEGTMLKNRFQKGLEEPDKTRIPPIMRLRSPKTTASLVRSGVFTVVALNGF